MSPELRNRLRYEWRHFWARENQLPPDWEWHTWLLLAGRGFGKTRVGAEMVNEWARTPGIRIALIGETVADCRDVMIEGESGILSCSPAYFKPIYQPSRRRLIWPNGSIARTYSGDTPDQLRGPQHHKCWADEPAKWRHPELAWDNMEFGLRLGLLPQVVATTTPRPIPLIRSLLDEKDQKHGTAVVRGSTYDNILNLPRTFINRVVRRYEGTRLGRQELHAEILSDTPGALWNRALLEATRRQALPALRRLIVGVDPGHDAGIVVAALGEDNHGYILDDLSISGTPTTWAKQVVTGYYKYQCNRVVAEVNHGADMVINTIHTVDDKVPVKRVWASQGKYARAEPVSALYEQERIHHIGMFPLLEDEMCDWVPDEGKPSPNRLDALVWAITELMLARPERREIDMSNTTDDLAQESVWR